MNAIFDIIAIPLGWLLEMIYKVVPDYFAALFVFTVVINIILFPLSLKSQKSQADRAKLAPRLERIQKKYKNDPKKLQEKQMALYEKEGVSMTGGCLPMLLRMLVLFGVFSVIYSPIKNLSTVPTQVVDTSITVMTAEGREDPNQFKGYYKELRVLQYLDKYEAEVKEAVAALEGYDEIQAQKQIDALYDVKGDFTYGGRSLLSNPWNEKGFAGINLLWLIPIISGLTSMLTSFISMRFTKQLTASETQQPGQGCSNNMMLITMPLFSVFIAFGVPGGVGVYWIFSNIVSLGQTLILNTIYNPAKIRAQAEIEYEERRKQRQEDKKRLAEARAREQRQLAEELKEQNKGEQKKKPVKKTADEKPAETSQGETAAETKPTDTEEKG